MTHAARFARYVVVGTLAFAIDLAVLLLLAGVMPLLAANSIAFILANIGNFVMAHFWVFGGNLQDLTLRRYIGTLGVSVVGLLLNDALVWCLAEIVHTGLVLAKVVATVVALGWNYTARVLWVYRT